MRLEIPQHTLLVDVQTHCDMLEHYLEQPAVVFAALLELQLRKVTLSDNNVNDNEEILKILKPLKTVTTFMCDHIYVKSKTSNCLSNSPLMNQMAIKETINL